GTRFFIRLAISAVFHRFPGLRMIRFHLDGSGPRLQTAAIISHSRNVCAAASAGARPSRLIPARDEGMLSSI
ncbi:hypothetical protein, partial [Bosea sp. LjRoot237]|uniref:hypothetical protein n=1 Tax=Bosea sp. LjRoot237 TaxID=3342292 RepID=UPI003F4F90AE